LRHTRTKQKKRGWPERSAPAAGPEGVEVEVEVTFDPDIIGECNAKILVTSPEGIEYTCILNGHGLASRPQGPLGSRATTLLTSRTLSRIPKSFTVAVDNPAFKTITSLPDVSVRSGAPFSVSYSGSGSGAIQAKLTVTSEGFPPWLYYLKGV